MSTENEQSLQKRPEIAIPDSMQEAGFSPMFSVYLKRLNDVLARIKPPRTTGFSLEILPDAKNPIVDFKTATNSPFKIELMGDNVIYPDVSRFAVRVTELEKVDAYLGLSDIKDFTSGAFPNTELTLYAEPIAMFYEERSLSFPYAGGIPGSLYEEEINESWKRAVQNARSSRTKELEKREGKPIVEDDLYTVMEEELVALTKHPDYKSFKIKMEGHNESVLNLWVPNVYGDNADCRVTRLYFRGRAQEVERVIEQFGILMGKVNRLPDRKQSMLDTEKQSLALPESITETK